MTPLIDVMLVLLVIFAITAPLMTLQPEAGAAWRPGAQPTEQAPRAIRLSLQANGALYWGEERLEADAFERRLAEPDRRRPGERPR